MNSSSLARRAKQSPRPVSLDFRRRAAAAGAAANRIPWRSAPLFPRRHAMPAPSSPAFARPAPHRGRPPGSHPGLRRRHQDPVRRRTWRAARTSRSLPAAGARFPRPADARIAIANSLVLNNEPARLLGSSTAGGPSLTSPSNAASRSRCPEARACLRRTTESLTQSTTHRGRSCLIRRFQET